jgi:hypothetical protein
MRERFEVAEYEVSLQGRPKRQRPQLDDNEYEEYKQALGLHGRAKRQRPQLDNEEYKVALGLHGRASDKVTGKQINREPECERVNFDIQYSIHFEIR